MSFKHNLTTELKNILTKTNYILPLCIIFLGLTVSFTFSYNNRISHLSIGVADLDESTFSIEVVKKVEQSVILELKEIAASYDELLYLVKKGMIYGGLYIPENFFQDLQNNKTTVLIIIADGSSPEIAEKVKTEFQRIINDVQHEYNSELGFGSISMEIVDVTTFFRQENVVELKNALFFALLTFITPVPLSLLLYEQQQTEMRNSKTHEAVNSIQILFSRLMAHFLIIDFLIIACLITQVVLFNVFFKGFIVDIFILLSLFVLFNVSIAFFFVSMSKSTQSLIALGITYLLINIIFSEVLATPPALIPDLQLLSVIIPMEIFVKMFQLITYREISILHFSNELFLLIIFIISLNIITFVKNVQRSEYNEA